MQLPDITIRFAQDRDAAQIASLLFESRVGEPKARDVKARANDPGMIRGWIGSAESATCGCPRHAITPERRTSRPHAFRTFSAQSNDNRRTRPVGPGYYISRLQRSGQPPANQM